MMQSSMNLADLQREIAAAVMTPLTEDDSMRTHAADGRAMSIIAEKIIAPNSRLSAFERLEIYNRQYWFRVLGALTEDYPALRVLLGARKFDALLVAYLTAHPSRSFTLRNLGSKLVDWLIAHPEYAGRRHGVAVDMARVEWAFVEAFDGAEYEPLTVEQIATLGSSSILSIQPHVQLLELDYPADEMVVALHDGEKRQVGEAGVKYHDEQSISATLPRIRRRKIWVAAHRVDFSVYYRRLKQEEYLTLSAIREGQSLEFSLEAGFRASTMSTRNRAQAVREWFSIWAELGWLYAPASNPSQI